MRKIPLGAAALVLWGSAGAAGNEVTPTCLEAAEWAHDALARSDPGYAREYRELFLTEAGKQTPNEAEAGCVFLLRLCPDTLSEILFAGRDGHEPSAKARHEVQGAMFGRDRQESGCQ